MRIAFWHDLPNGGGLRAMAEQLRALRNLGHEVAIWSPGSRDAGAASEWFPAGITVQTSAFPSEPGRGRLDHRFDTSVDSVRWRSSALETHAKIVCAQMEEWAADVVLAHPGWWFHTSPIGKFWRGSSLLYLQEPLRYLYEALPNNVWAARQEISQQTPRARLGSAIRDWRTIYQHRLQVRTEIDWAKQYNRVLVNSLFSRESVLRAYGLEAHFCQLGADHGTFAASPVLAKRRTVVSLGELAAHKGAELAVRAVASIPIERRPDLKWFGNRVDNGYARHVSEVSRTLDVNFTWHQMLPDEKLATELGEAACMIYCPRLEPLGFAPLEANLAGTAVVAVAEGGVRETVVPGKNGLLVTSRDAAALGAALDRYTSDLAGATRAGATARAHVLEHHSWHAAGIALEQQILSVCNMPSANGNHYSTPATT